MTKPVPSPCNSICRMNPASGYCEGCFRTLDEIASWASLSEDDKRAVWSALRQRRVQFRAARASDESNATVLRSASDAP